MIGWFVCAACAQDDNKDRYAHLVNEHGVAYRCDSCNLQTKLVNVAFAIKFDA